MKSGILNPRDTYGMDPHLFVDPNLIYNHDHSKGIPTELFDINTVILPDEANYLDPNIMEFMQSSDTQLENIILNGSLCDEYQLDFSVFDDYNDDINGYEKSCEIDTPSPSPVSSVDIANYEEVMTSNITDCNSSVSSLSTYILNSDNSDNDSINSDIYTPILKKPKTTSNVSKRSRVSKRPRRVHDDRIKYQNKVAAVKYRKRKRTELQTIEDKLADEEKRSKILKTNVKELKMQINIIKDLIGKYLPSHQLKSQQK